MKHLSAITLIGMGLSATAYGAASGLNIIPDLPSAQTKVSTSNSSDADEGEFWGGFWNNTGGVSWKEFLLRANLNYRAFYTDNSLANTTTRKDDFMHYLSPLVVITRAFESESRATVIDFSYQPTIILSSFGNAADRNYQLVRGVLSHNWNESSITLDHRYQKSSESSSQVSYLAPQDNNLTRGGFQTPLNSKITLSVDLEQSLTTSSLLDSGAKQDLGSWEGTVAARYELRPKLTTGLGFAGGYSEQQSPSHRFAYANEKVISTWVYQLSGKISIDLDVGAQMAQSTSAGTRDPGTTPLFSTKLRYALRYGTQISVSAGTTGSASQFYGANYLTQSSVDFSIRQRVFESFALIGRFGYIDGGYEELRSSVAATRRDFNGMNLSGEFEWQVNARLKGSVFYQYLSRRSQARSESYSANQVGINLNLSL